MATEQIGAKIGLAAGIITTIAYGATLFLSNDTNNQDPARELGLFIPALTLAVPTFIGVAIDSLLARRPVVADADVDTTAHSAEAPTGGRAWCATFWNSQKASKPDANERTPLLGK